MKSECAFNFSRAAEGAYLLSVRTVPAESGERASEQDLRGRRHGSLTIKTFNIIPRLRPMTHNNIV